MSRPIDDYIERLKKLTGTATDTELAESLGKAKQTISSWRRRGSIPLMLQYDLADKYGPQAAFSREVEGATTARERQAILAVWLSLYDDYRSELDPAEDAERYVRWAQALLFCEDDIRDTVRKLSFVNPSDNQFTMAELVKVLVRAGDLPQVGAAIDIWVRGLGEHDPEGDG